MGHEVFISHSQSDKAFADAVCRELETRNIRCWIAPRDIPPASSWAASITEAIASCRIMVLVFSSHANMSQHVMTEVGLAADQGVRILPVRVENVAPADDLKYYLSRRHWLDVMTMPLAQQLRRIVDVVESCLPNRVHHDVGLEPAEAPSEEAVGRLSLPADSPSAATTTSPPSPPPTSAQKSTFPDGLGLSASTTTPLGDQGGSSTPTGSSPQAASRPAMRTLPKRPSWAFRIFSALLHGGRRAARLALNTATSGTNRGITSPPVQLSVPRTRQWVRLRRAAWVICFILALVCLIVAVVVAPDADEWIEWFIWLPFGALLAGWAIILRDRERSNYTPKGWLGRALRACTQWVFGLPEGRRWYWRAPRAAYFFTLACAPFIALGCLVTAFSPGNSSRDRVLYLTFTMFSVASVAGLRWLSLIVPIPSAPENCRTRKPGRSGWIALALFALPTSTLLFILFTFETLNGEVRFGPSWGDDWTLHFYQRPLPQVFSVAKTILASDAAPPGENDSGCTLSGNIGGRHVWIRLDNSGTNQTGVSVQVRGSLGQPDASFARQIEEQIASELKKRAVE